MNRRPGWNTGQCYSVDDRIQQSDGRIRARAEAAFKRHKGNELTRRGQIPGGLVALLKPRGTAAVSTPEARLTTSEAATEYRRLYTECAAAIAHASALLQAEGPDSQSFLTADRNAVAQWQRLREVGGLIAKPRIA